MCMNVPSGDTQRVTVHFLLENFRKRNKSKSINDKCKIRKKNRKNL